MHRVVMPVATEDLSASRLQVSVHLQTEVIAPEAARRHANVWLLEHVGNLLRAQTPELVLGERLRWRVDVVLTNPETGRVGQVGRIEMDAETNEVLADETTIEALMANVYALIED
jgi:hypothetical protein